MPPWSDPGLERVLGAYGIDESALLGFGGEARVYALDADRVLRVSHGLVEPVALAHRHALVNELRRGGAPFLLPEVLDAGEVAGRSCTVERRMPGRPVSELLETAEGVERRELIERHLSASAALGGLALEPRAWFGELIAGSPIRADSWQEFLVPMFGEARPEQFISLHSS